jgi:hypothetical protein
MAISKRKVLECKIADLKLAVANLKAGEDSNLTYYRILMFNKQIERLEAELSRLIQKSINKSLDKMESNLARWE